MTRQMQGSGDRLIRYNLAHSGLVYQPDDPAEPMARDAISEIKAHLGGSDILKQLGAGALVADANHVSFVLNRHNPKGVHAVVIAVEPGGDFHMDFYGERQPGYLTAPRLASAAQVVPENLATVLGQLTGIEKIHHHHY